MVNYKPSLVRYAREKIIDVQSSGRSDVFGLGKNGTKPQRLGICLDTATGFSLGAVKGLNRSRGRRLRAEAGG
jgi:hypothetical protein